MNIISLQSAVAYGHVGNSTAVFAMQRLGHEVWPVNTVNFSNHTEYPAWRGPVIATSDIADILDAMSWVYPQVDVFLTGYLGSPELAEVVRRTVERIKDANPDARYVCDPVIGNATVGSFVGEEMPDVFREELIPLADAITPNQWELALLAGLERQPGVEKTAEAARGLNERALVTSVDTGNDATIGLIDVTADQALMVETPRLGGNVVGAGDLATALYTALLHEDPTRRLEHLAGSMFDVVSDVRERGLDELPLVERQGDLVAPRSSFSARAVVLE